MPLERADVADGLADGDGDGDRRAAHAPRRPHAHTRVRRNVVIARDHASGADADDTDGMDIIAFRHSMFELVDLWTDSVDPADISWSVTAASVRVATTVRTPSAAVADATLSHLENLCSLRQRPPPPLLV